MDSPTSTPSTDTVTGSLPGATLRDSRYDTRPGISTSYKWIFR
jgi:hypothetical protein